MCGYCKLLEVIIKLERVAKPSV